MKKQMIGEPFAARLTRILECIALAVALLFALALAGTSLFASARISPEQYGILQIDLFGENALANAAVVVIGILVLALIGKITVTKRFNVIFGTAALTMLAMFGVVWVLSVKAHAESDGDVLIQIAERIIAGDYAPVANSGEYLHYYLVRFPYQCGLLAFLEASIRIFGATGTLSAVRLANVALLISSYAALLLIADRLFHDQRITFMTLLLLCFSVQPLISTTFVYGLIPAFALCVWGVYFTIRYVQNGKIRNMIPAAFLFALAALLRSNTWIVIAAVGIVLALVALRRKKFMPLLLFALIAALALPLPKLAQTSYEKRLDTSFGTGYPKSYWMAMSLQKGWKATGWHVQDYQLAMQDEYGEDTSAIDARAKEDIRQGVAELLTSPSKLGNYLFEKLVSQWDEPTFMSVWITKAVPVYTDPKPLAQFVYGDSFDDAYRLVMKKTILVLYASYALGVGFLLQRGESERLLLPLIVLGGILFHLLFEAKSQYVLEYLPLFCPIAAYGIRSIFNKRTRGLRKESSESPQ